MVCVCVCVCVCDCQELLRSELTYLLILYVKAKESWEMDPPEKLEQSEISKNKGTDYFKVRSQCLCVVSPLEPQRPIGRR